MKWAGASIITLSILFGGLIVSPLHAQSSDSERELSISPLRSERTIPAGTSQSDILTVYNTGTEELNVQMNTQLFKVTDLTYDYIFTDNNPAIQWIRYSPANFTLQPGKSQLVEYSVNVPTTAGIGDKYFALFASTTPGKTESPISTTERVASIVYMTVPGDVTRTGKLINLRSPLFTAADTTWSATIQNSGTASFRSHYSVTLETLWGQEIIKEDGDSLILANSVRLVSDDLKMPRWPGIYTVTYSVELGDSPTVITTQPIIYLPILQTLFLLIVIGITLIWFTRWIRKIKRKKRASPSAE